MSKLSDGIKRYNMGDVSAFDDIYAAMYRKVRITAMQYMKDHGEAEDATQEVFVVAAQKLGELKDTSTAVAWFMTVTRRTCLNKLRKNKDALLGEDGEYIMENVQEESSYMLPEDSAMGKEKSEIILEMVSILPLAQREALTMLYMDGLSIAEVAQVTNASESTVKSRASYGKTKLRSLVIEREKREGIKLRGFGFTLLFPAFIRQMAEIAPLSINSAESILLATKETAGIVGIISSEAASVGASVATAATATTGTAVGTKVIAASVASVIVAGSIITGVALLGGEDEVPEITPEPPAIVATAEPAKTPSPTPTQTPEPTPTIIALTDEEKRIVAEISDYLENEDFEAAYISIQANYEIVTELYNKLPSENLWLLNGDYGMELDEGKGLVVRRIKTEYGSDVELWYGTFLGGLAEGNVVTLSCYYTLLEPEYLWSYNVIQSAYKAGKADGLVVASGNYLNTVYDNSLKRNVLIVNFTDGYANGLATDTFEYDSGDVSIYEYEIRNGGIVLTDEWEWDDQGFGGVEGGYILRSQNSYYWIGMLPDVFEEGTYKLILE